MADNGGSATRDRQSRVLFDISKKPQYTPVKGYKQLVRRLKQTYAVDVNTQDLTVDRMLQFDIVVFPAPQESFSDIEFDLIRQYLDRGGSVFLLLGDGHGGHFTPLNGFLNGFGIHLNEDCVVRTVIHNYLHPKEVCITNGVTNRELNRAAADRRAAAMAPAGGGAGGGGASSSSNNPFGIPSSPFDAGSSGSGDNRAAYNSIMAQQQQQQQGRDGDNNSNLAHLAFVYPHGLTMNVQRPAVPLLSSGFMAYPLNRPICAAWECPSADAQSQRRGKLLVYGSAQAFEDAWLVKEENDDLVSVLFDYLLHRIKLNHIDAENPEIADYNYIPDTASLAGLLRVAVEEQADIPRDFTQMFDTKQFRFDTDLVHEVVTAYDQVGVKHEPLTLIHPEFNAPLPPRLPATFGPIHRDPPAPALDLFDLDEEFASERVRLSQLTNKCAESNDVEFFIREAAEIMGVTKKLRSPRNKDPRALLDYVFRQVVNYKKAGGAGAGGGGGGAVGDEGGASPMGIGHHQHHQQQQPQGAGGAAAAAALAVGGAEAAGAQEQQQQQQQQQGGSGFNPSNNTKVYRMAANNDGTTPPEGSIPFEPPWAFSLVVDEASGRIAGQLEVTQESQAVLAQVVAVEGDTQLAGAQRQLVWRAMIRKPDNTEEPMTFNALEVPSPDGAQDQVYLQGQVEGFGYTWQFNYACNVGPYFPQQ